MRSFVLLVLFLFSFAAQAQNAAPSWLENTLYGNGKLNVVLIVVAVIILGIGLWMFRMDSKLKKMEERMNK